MGQLRLLLLIAAALFVRQGYTATITVPLFLSPTALPDGEALIGEFELANPSAHIDSVAVEFALPDGFQGWAGTTGNSSFGTHFGVFMLPPDAPSPRLAARSRAGFFQSLLRVPANEVVQVPFYSIYDLNRPFETIWPEHLLEDVGRIAFAVVSYSSYHPLPTGEVVSSTSALRLPAQVTDARLLITTQVIPEPANCLLLALASILMFLQRQTDFRRKTRSVR